MQFILKQSKIILIALTFFSVLLVLSVSDVPPFTRLSYYPAPPAVIGSDEEVPIVPAQPVKTNTSNVWANISNGFELDHKTQTAQVQAEIRKMLAERGKLQSILNTAAPYISYIYQQTRMRGLPAEIALIPVIESEFNPNDRSTKGATGLWQLMPQTAHELGIKVSKGYDGRRNVVASTKAALAYFRDLGNLFKGNWYLAIAAYNAGQFRVLSAVKKSGSSSFWNLHLPLETRLYVPRLLAVAEIVENPHKYGITLPAVSSKPYFSQLTLNKSVSLSNVAKTSGINLKTLQNLNPDYHKEIPKQETKILLVPANKATVVAENLKVADNVKPAPVKVAPVKKPTVKTKTSRTSKKRVRTAAHHSRTVHKRIHKKV